MIVLWFDCLAIARNTVNKRVFIVDGFKFNGDIKFIFSCMFFEEWFFSKYCRVIIIIDRVDEVMM